MKSGLGAFVCFATVYVGCSWFVVQGLDDSHIRTSEENGGWVVVSEPTLKSPYQRARHPEASMVDSYEAGSSAAQFDDPAYRDALPWMARARNFDPSSL